MSKILCVSCGNKLYEGAIVHLCSTCLKTHTNSKKKYGEVWNVDYFGEKKRLEQCPIESWKDWSKDDEVNEGEFFKGLKCGKLTSDTSYCGTACPLVPLTFEEEKKYNSNKKSFLNNKVTEFFNLAIKTAKKKGC